MDLNDRETCTILAALRYYQSSGFGDMHRLPADLASIAVHGPSGLVPLDDGEIDSLCERLNIVDAETASAVRAPTPGAAGKAVHEEADRILRDTPLIDPAAVAAQLVAWSERNLTEET
jgi:hypothetical protein